MLTAEELHARARSDTNAGRHPRAVTLLRRALDRPADPKLRARILATLAYAEAELGHLALADDLCAEALGLDGLDTETLGVVHGQRGVVALRRARRADAFAEFGAAIRFLSADHEALGRNLLNRGNLHLEGGAPRRALTDFERALAESEQSGNERQAAKIRHNLGYTWFLLGDHVRALREMDAVAAFLAGQSPSSRAIGLQDRAEVLEAMGLPDDAVADLTHAIELFRAGRARRAEASAMLVLARLLASTTPEAGLAVARRASRRFAAMGTEIGRLQADALAAACVRGSPRRAVPDAAPLTRTLREHGLVAEADLLDVAHCGWLVGRGRLDEARAIRMPRSTRQRPNLWASHVGALRDAALGHPARALARIRRSLDAALALKASLGSLEMQTSSAGALGQLGRLGLSLALDRRDPELVLEWSERARAASSRVVGVRPPADARQAADLAELRTLLAFGRDPVRQRALQQAIRERAWRDAGSGATQPVTSLADTVAALARSDAVLVALLTTADSSSALVVDADGATLVDGPPPPAVEALLGGLAADLDVSAASLPPAIAASVQASLSSRLARLDALLLAPLADRLTGRRVVLTPPGAFAHIPWPLLPTLTGVPVTVARSATAWAAQPVGRPAQRAAFVAGPSLPRAEAEVGACAAHWPGARVLTGPGAGVRSVAAVAVETDVLHLAGHGRHHAENPLFSSVQLADGPVFGYDLYRVDPMPSTVVLSSCELGSRTRSDDPLGLVTAFLHGGARTVLAAPAALSDEAAERLMPALHARLAAGAPPADALADSLAGYGPGAPPLVCFGAGW